MKGVVDGVATTVEGASEVRTAVGVGGCYVDYRRESEA